MWLLIALTGIVLISILWVVSTNAVKDPKKETVTDGRFIAPEPFRAWIMEYSAKYGVPLDVAIRLAYEESKWNETATGKNANGTYDHGLYQLNSRYYTIKLTKENVRTALQVLGKYIKESETLKEAIMKYNAGPNFFALHGYWPQKSIELARRVVEGAM